MIKDVYPIFKGAIKIHKAINRCICTKQYRKGEKNYWLTLTVI